MACLKLLAAKCTFKTPLLAGNNYERSFNLQQIIVLFQCLLQAIHSSINSSGI